MSIEESSTTVNEKTLFATSALPEVPVPSSGAAEGEGAEDKRSRGKLCLSSARALFASEVGSDRCTVASGENHFRAKLRIQDLHLLPEPATIGAQ